MPKLSMPQCEICGTIDKVYPCAYCGRLTCTECKFIVLDNKCEHRLPELGASNPEWNLQEGNNSIN